MKKNTIILIIVLIIMMLLSFVLILIYNENNEDIPTTDTPEIIEEKEEETEEEEIIEEGTTLTDLKDHNRHFTLDSIINDYIIMVKTSNINVNNIVFDEFENSINNIFNGKTYRTDQVQFIKINDRITKYNIKGYLEQVTMGGVGEQSEFNTTIFLDSVNMTYQIALQYDYDKNISEILKNVNNEYSVSSMNKQYISSLYFANLKGKILRKDPNLDKIITNYNDLTNIEEIIYESIATYEIKENAENMILTIKDHNNNRYIFTIESVLNYTVKIY